MDTLACPFGVLINQVPLYPTGSGKIAGCQLIMTGLYMVFVLDMVSIDPCIPYMTLVSINVISNFYWTKKKFQEMGQRNM